MVTRVVGYTNERRRDRRRDVPIEATLDDQPILIIDIGLSGFGAEGARMDTKDLPWPIEEQRCELRFIDYQGRDVLLLVQIASVDPVSGRFGGKFYELPGDAFNVLQDLVMRRDLRRAAAAAE